MKNYIINNEKFRELLFFTALIIYLFSGFIFCSFYSLYFSDSFFKYSIFISCIILLFKELLHEKIKLNELIILIITFFLTIILIFRLNGYFTIPLLLFVYSAREIDFKKIVKVYLLLSIFALLFIVISSKLSIIPNYISIINNKKREFLGFRYALYPQILCFNITCLITYLKYNEKIFNKLFITLCLFIVNFYIFSYTGSRLSLILSIFILIIFLLFNGKNKIFDCKIVSFLLKNSFIVFSIISIIISLNYNVNSKFYNTLDSVLEHRLLLGNNAINEYGIKYFGNNVVLIGNGVNKYGIKTQGTYNYIDSLYISLLIKYGSVLTITILILLTISLHRIYNRKGYFLLIIFFAFSLHGMIDDLGFYLYYNAFWLAILSQK